MEEEFVPYELAVKLKALGFDKECIKYYWADAMFTTTNEPPLNHNKRDILISAPPFSQAFRWFREKFDLYSHVRESYSFDNTLEFVSQINGSYVNHGISDKPINRFDTYEEAELACLTKLIEIVEKELIKSE